MNSAGAKRKSRFIGVSSVAKKLKLFLIGKGTAMAKKMNFRVMILLAVMLVVISTSSAWADLTDGLVAHWKLDSDANDSAGNINNTYSFTLYKDIITPTLVINSPANNTYWNSVPDIQVTASDTYFGSPNYIPH